jgi:hypothetical protein
MGMLNSYGEGANAFATNFMGQINQGRKFQFEAQQLAMQDKYRQAQEALLSEQVKAAELERGRQTGFQNAIQGAIRPPMAEQDAMFAAAQQPMPQGDTLERSSADNTAVQGLMAGGLDYNKAIGAAMPFTKSAEFPQMIAAVKAIEMMPVEQQLKILEMFKTQSEIKKNESDNVTAVAAGDRVIFYDKKTGKEIRQEKVGVNPAVQLKIDSGGKSFGDKLDYESGKKLISTLPKMKDEAVVAAVSLDKMKYMVDLMDKGAGGTAGALKAAVAPYAELFGYNPKSLSDAQAFQLAAKTISGSMRMAIIGPGQVSNYEQQLLQSLSGGGNTARAAAKELYSLYAKEAKDRVSKYNDSVSALHELSPKSKTLWKPIEMNISGGAAEPVNKQQGLRNKYNY